MPAFIDRVQASEGRLLWLDFIDYAGRLLTRGAEPWLDSSVCAAWLCKAQALLGSDVLALPLGRVCGAWIDACPALHAAMGARARAVFPLKTLLADESLRAHLTELARAVRASVRGLPLVLTCPSPRAWVAEASAQIHGVQIEVGEDDADSAALYIADFLRTFREAGIDALLLVESPATEPASAANVACYRSVLNVAAHYRWDAGLFVPGLRYVGGDAGLDFVIAPQALPGSVSGRIIADDFWTGVLPPDAAAGDFRYAVIPAHGNPERVLERRALLG